MQRFAKVKNLLYYWYTIVLKFKTKPEHYAKIPTFNYGSFVVIGSCC